jgi:hypothetical protein
VPSDKFHHYVGLVAIDAEVVDADNVGIGQGSDVTRLPFESSAEAFV